MIKAKIDYFKIAVCRPNTVVADPWSNFNKLKDIVLNELREDPPHLLVTPELFLTGFSCDELFFDSNVQRGVENSIKGIISISKSLSTTFIIGSPLYTRKGLFNAAIVINQGVVHGAIPKSYLANDGEYYEGRYFNTIRKDHEFIEYSFGSSFKIAASQVFSIVTGIESDKQLRFSAEICEDLWAPSSPSTEAYAEGASIVFNLSASNALYGKSNLRKTLANAQTKKFKSTYIYVSSGYGESNNDMVWDGEIFVSQNGKVSTSTAPFDKVYLKKFAFDNFTLKSARIRSRTANIYYNHRIKQDCVQIRSNIKTSLSTKSEYIIPVNIQCYPYLESDRLKMQDMMVDFIEKSLCQALSTRCKGAGIKNLVLGVSGGLDSTFALLILHKFKTLSTDINYEIHAITLPTQNTSEKTLALARELCNDLGIDLKEINIQDSINMRLKQLDRDSINPILDTTYENVQAGERTSLLFRFANKVEGLVIGTGDLSELALGWCTYGVGDQMSHYSLNSGIPKTVIQGYLDAKVNNVCYNNRLIKTLRDILHQQISPELLPPNQSQQIQATEDVIGKYVLVDFFLYYYLEYRCSFDEIAMLAITAFKNNDSISKQDIDLVNQSFKARFFKSQFKRTAMPNGPKLFINGSLSPRSDWRQPSIVNLNDAFNAKDSNTQ